LLIIRAKGVNIHLECYKKRKRKRILENKKYQISVEIRRRIKNTTMAEEDDDEDEEDEGVDEGVDEDILS